MPTLAEGSPERLRHSEVAEKDMIGSWSYCDAAEVQPEAHSKTAVAFRPHLLYTATRAIDSRHCTQSAWHLSKAKSTVELYAL